MNDPARPIRLFSVSEATALLPVITPILERMQRDQQALDDAGNRLEALSAVMRENGHALKALRLENLALHLRQQITADMLHLTALGIELKQISTGLVDFPALRQGELVLLCWKLGEPEIAYWHEPETGFAGRKPLDFTGDGAR